jgi:hypothetical protein
MLGCRSLTGGAGLLGLLAETSSQQQVLTVRGLQGALQFGDLLAVAALELGDVRAAAAKPVPARKHPKLVDARNAA